MPDEAHPRTADPEETTVPTEGTPEPVGEPLEEESPGPILRGATVSPGLVLGLIHLKDYDLASVGRDRVPLDEVDLELNRFRRALDESRRQLVDLKERLVGRVPAEDARILDTHVTYLRDSVFIADVENLILNEQMRLDAAIAKVIGDFDRIFRLVKSESLRQSAVDLRDVGIRVLRNLERDGAVREQEEPSNLGGDYILVARELSIVDMFNLANEHVRGIVTEQGGLTSHAAIFARSMRIPTLVGVEGLLDHVAEGDFVILDATEGVVRIEPDAVVREQYAGSERAASTSATVRSREWAPELTRTKDGEEITVAASCGNLPEVEQARGLELPSIGLYRTELLYLIDRRPPSHETLVQHYRSVLGAAQDMPVSFRLLNVDSSIGLPYLHEGSELNPSLGQGGVRALLARPAVLRRQLRALLTAAGEGELRIALPFVNDCGDLRRVKEVLFEERLALSKERMPLPERVATGVVIETPTAMLGIRDLALESEFLMLNLDSLQQYLLAKDRENPAHAAAFTSLHPYVLRALKKATEVAALEARPLSVFGITSRKRENLPFLVGVGLRHFCVPPAELESFLDAVAAIEVPEAAERASAAAAGSCPEESQSRVAGYHHGQPQA